MDKSKKQQNKETRIIRAARIRAGIDTDKELATRIGMPTDTFKYRLKFPSTWKKYELAAIIKITGMVDEDILELVKG